MWADEESVTASSPSGGTSARGVWVVVFEPTGRCQKLPGEPRVLLRKAGSSLWGCWGCSECEYLLPAGLGALGGGKTKGEAGKAKVRSSARAGGAQTAAG